jgi:acetylornithine deacetylase/succinyl-diaminopimelate desuccinylase-like protein
MKRDADHRLDPAKVRSFVDSTFETSVIPALKEYVTIPNQSPAFDPGWREAGHMERAVNLITAWIRDAGIPSLKLEVIRIEGRTPLIFAEAPGRAQGTVLLYGHLDKQPPMEPWSEGLGPWKPVIRDGRLFGRGAGDDGYAAFSAATAMAALARAGVEHARLVLVVEAAEESGSPDLPFHIDLLKDRIGSPSLVVCLDSGCGDYERLWSTTSLRGLVSGTLRVDILREGVHSGDASGIVPDSFRIIRSLLSRIEDERTGEIRIRDLHGPIPQERVSQARLTADVLGDAIFSKMPWVDGAHPVTDDPVEIILNRTWRPKLAITGQSGLPPLESAGNVLRPTTALKLSMRLPPSVDGEKAGAQMKRVLEADPPYGARVSFTLEKASKGWDAPKLAPWLAESTDQASTEYFGKKASYFGEGGSIPFMGMLGERFPRAQFLVTGVLGPHSNAHGPNEFLDLKTAKSLTCCVARVLADHAHQA